MNLQVLFAIPALVWVMSVAWILKPWRIGELRRIVEHAPLEPWRPERWWTDLLVRYLHFARRWTAVVMIAVLSALVAVGLPEALSQSKLDLWFSDILVLFWGPLYFLFAWFFVDIAAHVWRITNGPDFESRSFWFGTVLPGLLAGATGPALVGFAVA